MHVDHALAGRTDGWFCSFPCSSLLVPPSLWVIANENEVIVRSGHKFGIDVALGQTQLLSLLIEHLDVLILPWLVSLVLFGICFVGL